MIKLKNVYDVPSVEDGKRVLIERLWPMEADVYTYKIDLWLKDLAPSYGLLEFLRENTKEYLKFKEDYQKELQEKEKQVLFHKLLLDSQKGTVTLLYRHLNMEHSSAKIVAEILQKIEVEK